MHLILKFPFVAITLQFPKFFNNTMFYWGMWARLLRKYIIDMIYEQNMYMCLCDSHNLRGRKDVVIQNGHFCHPLCLTCRSWTGSWWPSDPSGASSMTLCPSHTRYNNHAFYFFAYIAYMHTYHIKLTCRCCRLLAATVCLRKCDPICRVSPRGTCQKSGAPLWLSSCSTGPWPSWQAITGHTTRPSLRRRRSSTWWMWRTGTSRSSSRCYGGSRQMTLTLLCIRTSRSPSTNCCKSSQTIWICPF